MTSYNLNRKWRVTYLVETARGTDVFEIEIIAQSLWVAACRGQRVARVDARAIITVEEITE